MAATSPPRSAARSPPLDRRGGGGGGGGSFPLPAERVLKSGCAGVRSPLATFLSPASVSLVNLADSSSESSSMFFTSGVCMQCPWLPIFSVLGMAAARLYALRRSHRSASHCKHFCLASASAPAAAASLTELPKLERTLVETCRACLKALHEADHGTSESSSISDIRWSVEVDGEIPDSPFLHSRFHIDQVPAHQGRALGNTLRRTLLRQDLFRTHAAVAFRLHHRPFNTTTAEDQLWWSRAEPALHEFSAVAGVQESMLEIVRNVQQLSISRAPWKAPGSADLAFPIAALASAFPDQPDAWRWALRRCGPCAVCAQDLDIVDGSAHFESPLLISEPRQQLCRITAPTILELEVEATCCSQFEWEESEAFEKYRERLRLDGWLLVPPLLSPVKKVSYSVTACDGSGVHGGEATETVQLEVWTSKAANPSELLRTSASTLLAGLAARAAREGQTDLTELELTDLDLPYFAGLSQNAQQKRKPETGARWEQRKVSGNVSLQESQATVGQRGSEDPGAANTDVMVRSGLSELLDGALLGSGSSGDDEVKAGLKGITDELLRAQGFQG